MLSSLSSRKDRLRLFVLLVLLPALTACGRDGEPAAGIHAEDDIPSILNQAEEPYPEPWLFTRELIAGVAYGDTAYMLRAPLASLVLEDGTWIVLDSRPLEFRLYTSGGRFIRSFGREGGGPTDLNWTHDISRLIDSGGGHFEYWFHWPILIQTWNLEGDLLDIRSMDTGHPLVQRFYPRSLAMFGDRLHTFTHAWRQIAADETIATTFVVAGDWGGSSVDTLYSFETTPTDRWANMAQAAFDYPIFNTLLMTTAGRLYLAAWDSDWIVEIDREHGGAIRRFRLEHEPMTIPDHQVERMRSSIGN